MKYVYAGDRKISVKILKFLIEKGHYPKALLVSEKQSSSHASELIELCKNFNCPVIEGKSFTEKDNVEKFKFFQPDYFICIHFPYIITKQILNIPNVGFLNLHPAFLPFNRGWNTPTWAIIDDTKYGATLHFMSEELDRGDIIHQKELIVEPYETANELYQRVLKMEEQVFYEAFDDILSLNPKRLPQFDEIGTTHNKKDLGLIQKIDLENPVKPKDLINKLRALTTNNWDESAYFVIGNKKIRIKVEMKSEEIE